MRILHIWDQAGVACVFAKYQQIQGHDSKVILQSDRDKFGIYEFYEGFVQTVKLKEFNDTCIQEANSADIVHIHSLYHLVPILRAKFGKSKKIILHYLGTDLRAPKPPKNKILYTAGLNPLAASLLDRAYIMLSNRARHKRAGQKMAHRLADAVLVSARDLLQYAEDGIFIPLPVDTDHFKPDTLEKSNKKEALTIDNARIDMQMALNHCTMHNIHLDIEVYDRAKYPILYKDMPLFLKKYKVYVDIRFIDGKIIDQLSTTAVQSLACGLRILDYELKYRQGLPTGFEAKSVVSKLSDIYSMNRTLAY